LIFLHAPVKFDRLIGETGISEDSFIEEYSMAKGKNRDLVKLKSTESAHCYYTKKNRRNTTARIEIKKYDPTLRRHVMYRETR
jgi:large subunit ribosomal protein L33